jgi:multidrug resistance efflux pump
MTADPRDLEAAFRRALARGERSRRRILRHDAAAAIAAAGITQREAARRLGVTHEHLNRVLHGHRYSSRVLRAIAEITAP